MIRPTARLTFNIDPDVYSEELVVELKRCFLNVAPMQVRQLPALDEDGEAAVAMVDSAEMPADAVKADAAEEDADESSRAPARSELELIVVLNYPYWDSSVEGADANWNKILIPWLEKKLYKLNATVQGYNRTRGNGPCFVPYGRLVVSLGDVKCAFRLPSAMEFPSEIPTLLDRCRSLANDGALSDVALSRIDMPSAALDEAAEEADDAERTEATDGVDGLVASDGQDAFGASADSLAAGDFPTDGEAVQIAAADSEGLEVEEELEAPIDYRVWGVHFADGTVRGFDAEAGVWLS